MEDRETARLRIYGESKTTRIMMATVPHVTSCLGLRKFQADGFLLTRVYKVVRSARVLLSICWNRWLGCEEQWAKNLAVSQWCRSQWPRGLGRRSTAARLQRSWVRIPRGSWMSVVSVVCCQVEVSATSWSLVQRSCTDFGASLCVL